jgi:hypothetical protein
VVCTPLGDTPGAVYGTEGREFESPRARFRNSLFAGDSEFLVGCSRSANVATAHKRPTRISLGSWAISARLTCVSELATVLRSTSVLFPDVSNGAAAPGARNGRPTR